MKKEGLVIGTRGSQLALWQANWVKSALEAKFPDLSITLSIIKTRGDKILNVPLAEIGGKALFVKEIEEALLDGRVDLAVHSMKDMPAQIPERLCIGAICEREVPLDVLISRHHLKLVELPPGARVGTGSLRRAAQLRYVRPDVSVMPLRGNVDTRLRKIETENLDGIVLAAAGIRRLGLEARITQYLDETLMLPAVGQGAVGIEIRAADTRVGSYVEALDHPPTNTVVMGERAFLNRLEGDCQVPVAGHGTIGPRGFTLTGLVADVQGKSVVKDTLTGPATESEKIGYALADRLLAAGGDEILKNLKTS